MVGEGVGRRRDGGGGGRGLGWLAPGADGEREVAV